MPSVLVGPLLRFADAASVTVWVETDVPCTVEVLGRQAPTFTAAGHHYALVVLESLEPGLSQSYEVLLDGDAAWPHPGGPPAWLAIPAPGSPLRILAGSCRVAAPVDAAAPDTHGGRRPDLETDALAEVARRAMADHARTPHVLLLVGDQLYSDVPSPATLAFIRSRRNVHGDHGAEAMDFDEYAFAYRDAWTADPAVAWLLATVPSVMIFDDHDVDNGWNSSQAWVDAMRAETWWPQRITAAFASYWVYQHLGNLSPVELRADPLGAAALAGADITAALFDLARRAAGLIAGDPVRWSFARDLGGVRLVVVDSRSSRVLEEGARSMVPPAGWSWLDQQLTGGCDHLVVVTSVPVVLPEMVQRLEAWADRAGAGAWGRWGRAVAGRARNRLGLEHWPAYGDSADRLLDMLAGVAAGRRGPPPASVLIVSGEVHYGYVAAVDVPDAAPIIQLVSSPLRNPASRRLRRLHRISMTPLTATAGSLLARLAGAPSPRHRGRRTAGPWFRNLVTTLELAGRQARVTVERTLPPERGAGLEVVHDAPLA